MSFKMNNFTEGELKDGKTSGFVPAKMGVFALSRGDLLLYIGAAMNLREAVKAMLNGDP